MGATIRVMLSVIALGVAIGVAAPAQAADRSAEKILEEIDAIKFPRLDAKRAQDQDYMREYLAKRAEVSAKSNALIFELYKIAPNHERVPRLMYQRWSRYGSDRFDELFKDVDDVLAHDKNPKLRVEGTYCKARAKLWQSRSSPSPDLSSFEEFAKVAPGDPRGASLLRDVIAQIHDEKLKATLTDRIVRDYPNSAESRHFSATVSRPTQSASRSSWSLPTRSRTPRYR